MVDLPLLVNSPLKDKMTHLLQYSTVVVYRDHEGLGFLEPKYHPKASLIFTLENLGRIGQAQKCLQINHKPFHEVDTKFFIQQNFLLATLLTYYYY